VFRREKPKASTWRVKALQRAELLTDEELMFTAPLSISEKDFAYLREEIVKLITKSPQIPERGLRVYIF
jgi:hypothetical protein